MQVGPLAAPLWFTMTRLKALLIAAIMGTSAVAVADPTVRGGITIQLGDRTPPPPPRTYVEFDTYDPRYDGDVNVRTVRDISGVYDSQYGRITIMQQGNRITGHYANSAGPAMIKGRIRGDMVMFRWRQGANEGKGMFTIRGRRAPVLVGTWGTYDSRHNGGRWTLRPVHVGFRGDDRDNYRDNYRDDYRDEYRDDYRRDYGWRRD